jgi:hypothetical protein
MMTTTTESAARRSARKRPLALFLVVSLGGCRAVLGIDDLDEKDLGAGAGGQADAGTAGTSGAGNAGSAGKTGVGGVAGTAGAAGLAGAAGNAGKAGKAGSAGAGGAGGQTPVDSKACQNECRASVSKKGLEEYYANAKDCACSNFDPTGCKAVCGNDCDIKENEFGGKPKECISCISRKTPLFFCADEFRDCDGECAAFRVCIEACGG